MPQDTVELLKLSVQQDPDGHVTATVPVRWCLTPELVEMIRDRGFKRPYLMLVIRSVVTETHFSEPYTTYTDTDITFVRLAAEMTYVTFTRPGNNEVCAVVVDLNGRGVIGAAIQLESKVGSSSYYDDSTEEARTYASVLRADGMPKRSALRKFDGEAIPHIAAAATLNVEVPQEMFAPTPSGWRKTLVKAYFPTRELDQCHFRRRVIISLMTSVVWLPLAFAIKVVLTIAMVVWGRRNIPFRRIIQPLELNPFEIATDSEHSRWFYRNKQNSWDGWQPRHMVFRAVNPPVLLAMPLVTWLISHVTIMRDMRLWQAYAVTYGTLLAMAVAAGLVAAIVWLAAKVLRTKMPWTNPQAKAAREQQRAQTQQELSRLRQERMLHSLEAMTCTTSAATATVDALPKEKRTVLLRYYAFKVKVCRPFAR